MKRMVAPELLDHLPADDPRAVQSRKDLRKINFLMGHAGVFHRKLTQASAGKCFDQLVELGSGDGHLALRLARRLAPLTGPIKITLVDRLNLVSKTTQVELQNLGWNPEIITADVLDWLPQFVGGKKTMILANLFLHQFTESQIRRILKDTAARCVCFAVCDPRRSKFAFASSRLLAFIGCNGITQHDAVISVRAGFLGTELSKLWSCIPDWELQEEEIGPFSHWFSASKIMR